MPRFALPIVFAAAALVLVTSSADAQVYKWKDAHGTVHYSDAPPATGSQYEQVKLNGSVSTAVSPSVPATASSNADAGKMSAASATANTKPAPASTAKTPDTPDNRAKLCKELGSNIALLAGNQPLTSGDAKTQQQNMTDDQRRQELASARAQQKQYCNGG